MRRFVKGMLRRFGYDLVRYVDLPSCPFDVLGLAVEWALRKSNGLFVLQIGANDGVRGDPINELIRKHELSALLVEPIPALFSRLRENYASYPHARFECAAVGEAAGKATMYRVRPDAELPDWLQGIASFNRTHLSSARFGVKNLESYVEPVQVRVMSLPELLEKHGIRDVGLLQIDTEGYDCRLVRAALGCGLLPRIVHYEFIHCSPAERRDCKQLLLHHGYRFVDVGRDTLALRDD